MDFFKKTKEYQTVSIPELQLPSMIVTSKGEIKEANPCFLKRFSYVEDEIVGQNVHVLIPPRFMKKSKHEILMSRYEFGRKSNIIGTVRVLPLKNGEGEDMFMRVQILPFKVSEKEFRFLCFFHDIVISHVFDLDRIRNLLEEAVSRVEKTEEFRLDSQPVALVCQQIKLYLNSEIDLMCEFIEENKSNDKLSTMIRYFLLSSPFGNIRVVLRLFQKHFVKSEIAFLNALALRIIFPIILGRMQGVAKALENVKLKLYEDHLDSSRSSRRE